MTLAIANLLLNFLVVVLLVATISYCRVLNKRIKILQDGKSELANLLQYFDEATTRASESIIALQSASKKIGENIQMRIDKVNYLIDDLAFMVEKGSRLADRLDANFAVNRAHNRVVSENDVPEIFENAAEDFSNEEKNTSKYSPAVGNFPASKTANKLSIKEKTSASLEAVLERVVGRAKPANLNENTGDNDKDTGNRLKGATNARSKAEKELLDMIRAGIKG